MTFVLLLISSTLLNHTPIMLHRGETVGCMIQSKEHSVSVYDSKTKKYSQEKTFTEYQLSVYVRNKEKLAFEYRVDVPYESEEQALSDCREWRQAVQQLPVR